MPVFLPLVTVPTLVFPVATIIHPALGSSRQGTKPHNYGYKCAYHKKQNASLQGLLLLICRAGLVSPAVFEREKHDGNQGARA
jgi:hypothetical protein